jgi:hypothetical protein
MRAALAVLLLATVQEGPQKLKFQVEHLNLETKKAAPLKSERGEVLRGRAQGDGGGAGRRLHRDHRHGTLKPDANLRWTELKAAGRRPRATTAASPSSSSTTLKLEAASRVTLHVEKNATRWPSPQGPRAPGRERERRRLRGALKSPVDVVTLVKAVGEEDGRRIQDLRDFKDVVWHAPPRPESTSQIDGYFVT